MWFPSFSPISMREDPKNPGISLQKICIFILTWLNFSHVYSSLHLMQYIYCDAFFNCSKHFWIHWFWCLLVLLLFFCVTSSTSAKRFPLRIFCIRGNKKVTQADGEIGWIGLGSCCFWSKTAEHSVQCVDRCAYKSPIMKWANELKESSQKIHWSWMQPLPAPAGTLIQMGS